MNITVENYPPHPPKTLSYLQEWGYVYDNEREPQLESLRLVYLDDMPDGDKLLAQNAATALSYLKRKYFGQVGQ